jgi:hypothetical protein
VRRQVADGGEQYPNGNDHHAAKLDGHIAAQQFDCREHPGLQRRHVAAQATHLASEASSEATHLSSQASSETIHLSSQAGSETIHISSQASSEAIQIALRREVGANQRPRQGLGGAGGLRAGKPSRLQPLCHLERVKRDRIPVGTLPS